MTAIRWLVMLGSVLGAMAYAGCERSVSVAAGEAPGKPASPVTYSEQVVEYRHGEVTLEGFVVWDAASDKQRPGVMVVHAWMGLNDFCKERARALAREGYVAFCADIYGKGVRPRDNEAAAQEAGKYRADRPLLRARATAGLEWLKSHALVDKRKVAAIGYCFGGGTVLELARSGAELKGVVSFHGNLDTPNLKDAAAIRCKVLVQHGADDPFVKAESVRAFENEMRNANVDWQFIQYGNAVHSFTEPAAGNDNSKGAAYNAAADRRSWALMRSFLAEAFA